MCVLCADRHSTLGCYSDKLGISNDSVPSWYWQKLTIQTTYEYIERDNYFCY